MASITNTIYSGTDGVITLTGLTLQPANTVVTGAVVTGYLYSDGSVVSNWNGISFTDATGGVYTAAFTAANVPAAGTYTLKLVCTKSGLTLTLWEDIVVTNLLV